MTGKRSHKNTKRITAAERVDAYAEFVFGSGFASCFDDECRAYLIKAFGAHARATLARFKRREARK